MYSSGKPIRSCNCISQSRKLFIQLFICFLLVLQAAHQSSAHTGNLCLVKRQILLFCHLYGYRCKLRQICVAAQTSSADTDSSQNLCLIANTNLTKFDTRFKNCCQIFYQLAKINSAVSSEIKQHFIIIQCILCIYQFHFQTMFTNLFLTDFKCLSLSDSVLCLSLVVLLCCHTKNFFERVNNIFLTYFSWCKYDFPVFNSPGCLHDHVIACFNFIIFRTEIINLAYITKSHAYYFCHSISP